MSAAEIDQRSQRRRALDEQIATKPALTPLELPGNAVAVPMEAHLSQLRRPVAVAGIVENGLIRPLDPVVKLAEHTRVIIVAAG